VGESVEVGECLDYLGRSCVELLPLASTTSGCASLDAAASKRWQVELFEDMDVVLIDESYRSMLGDSSIG
jgi:hypothetical protein